jgi:hypothetical protein
MVFYNLPAFYQYYCVPKIEKDAFLIGNILEPDFADFMGGIDPAYEWIMNN